MQKKIFDYSDQLTKHLMDLAGTSTSLTDIFDNLTSEQFLALITK